MKYTTAYEVASIAMEKLSADGWKFKPHTARFAALAACQATQRHELIRAFEDALSASRINNWDGSVA